MTGSESSEEENRRHAEKMAKRKAARAKILATKTEERGLVIVDTGKGKSTAAFGMAVRALGHGMRVGIVQFVKGAWDMAKAMIGDPSNRMVIPHELNIVLRYNYLPLEEVLEVLRGKPRDLHVVVTGRNARPELVELADLVTDMTMVKHPFRSGVRAQAGIEF